MRLLRPFALVMIVTSSWLLPGRAGADEAFPPATPESQGLTAASIEGLAATVREFIAQDQAVGAELLVIRNRRTVYHEAFGRRDVERDVPMTRDTIFNIRSMTKPLTGAAVQILIDRGRLSLDDPVARYIAGFDTDASRGITVGQLLAHRGGLPLSILNRIDEYPDLQAIAAAAGARGPEFEPGSKFWYSDTGTDVLAAIVERIEGVPIDVFVRHELLMPLGMDDSFYMQDMTDPRVERVATLYVGTSGAWTPFWRPEAGGTPMYPFAWGSQTLYSTPMDYAKFIAMWLDGGMVGDRMVLSPDAARRTLTPISRMTMLGNDAPYPTLFPDLEVWYGRLAMLAYPRQEGETPPDGRPVCIGHSGSDGTVIWAWPDRDLIIAYFTQSRGALTTLRLEDAIDRFLLHPERGATAEAPEALRRYLGPYVANFSQFNNVEFTVVARGERLAIDIPGQLVFELNEPDAAGRRTFVMTDAIAVTFIEDDAGVVTGLTLEQGGQTVELPKGHAVPVARRTFAAKDLEPCVGAYARPVTGERIEVRIEDDTLALRIPEAPGMPLTMFMNEGESEWRLRMNASVRIRFDRDEQGRVVSFTSIQPDGTESVQKRIDEPAADDGAWISLFNGVDLDGWTPKFAGHPPGENLHDTFRVEGGVLKADYRDWTGFAGEFGHLFHRTTFSHYVLELEYRFTGDQMPGAPGWAYRNSGVMIHGQSAESMGLDQPFPVSIEVQMLGGDGTHPRPTGNLCTPGTHVVMDDALVTRHCIDSTSATFHGDQWVTLEIEVHGGDLIRHRVNGEVVLEYRSPQLDSGDVDAARLIEARGGVVALSEGTISLQAESHPCEFRNIRLRRLPAE